MSSQIRTADSGRTAKREEKDGFKDLDGASDSPVFFDGLQKDCL